jgi:heme-degrading monooxygenase HmoA
MASMFLCGHSGGDSVIRVLIEWQCKRGQEHALENLLMDLRNRSAHQPGYMSGETLVVLDEPTSYLVISNWTRLEAWKHWKDSQARLEIVHMMVPHLTDEPRMRIYSSPAEQE